MEAVVASWSKGLRGDVISAKSAHVRQIAVPFAVAEHQSNAGLGAPSCQRHLPDTLRASPTISVVLITPRRLAATLLLAAASIAWGVIGLGILSEVVVLLMLRSPSGPI